MPPRTGHSSAPTQTRHFVTRRLLPVGDLLSDGQVQELLLHLRHRHCPPHLLPSWIHAVEARALCSPGAFCTHRSLEACRGPPGWGEVSPAPRTFSHAGVRCLSRRGVLLCPHNLSDCLVQPHRVPGCCSASPPQGRGRLNSPGEHKRGEKAASNFLQRCLLASG